MYISLENDPLLFVQGPPVYRYVRKVSRWQEESTSIFPDPVVNATEAVVETNIESNVEINVETKTETDSLMWQRLRFLTSDFAKFVYKPLFFQLRDGEKLRGVVDALYPDSVLIRSSSDVITEIEINEIKEIWWGGKVLPIRL